MLLRALLDSGDVIFEHVITIRDLRLRFGAPEVFAAACSCGWLGPERGELPRPEHLAVWDGKRHVYDQARQAT